MYRFAICAIFVALCFASFPILAEETAGTHVCVGILANYGNPKAAQESLIKSLSKQKKLQLTPVPMASALLDDAVAEAKQKHCDYVVTTNLLEDHNESGYSPMPGTGTMNVPHFFVTTSYKLNKVSDGAELSSGNFKAQDTGSSQNAIAFTMNKVAAKVDSAIKDAK